MMAADNNGRNTRSLAGRELRWDVRETRIRQPRKVVRELKRLAEAKGITMNALITDYIDAGMKRDGRLGVHQIAPWFTDYLRPKGGSSSLGGQAGDVDEDFT